MCKCWCGCICISRDLENAYSMVVVAVAVWLLHYGTTFTGILCNNHSKEWQVYTFTDMKMSRKRWIGGAQRIFRAVKLLCMIWKTTYRHVYIMTCVHINIHLSKPTLIVTNVPLWWRVLILGRLCVDGAREYMGNLCTFHSISLWI